MHSSNPVDSVQVRGEACSVGHAYLNFWPMALDAMLRSAVPGSSMPYLLIICSAREPTWNCILEFSMM